MVWNRSEKYITTGKRMLWHDRSEWVVVDGQHEPLVSEELFALANERAKPKKKLAMNRSSADAIDLIRENENISLLKIVFFVAINAVIQDRIKRHINDLLRLEYESLKINLLELFTVVNYTSYCGIPCSMDMIFLSVEHMMQI